MEHDFFYKGLSQSMKINVKLLVLFLFALLVHFPSVFNDFTNWDDDKYVTENRRIQVLSTQNLLDILNPRYTSSDPFPEYQPIRDLSLALDFMVWKKNPFGYHLSNIFLHATNVIILFFFLSLLFKRRDIAFVSALIFACHPVHVESVAWITSRKDLLGFLFTFLSGILFLKYLLSHNKKQYIASLFLFVAALLSKSQAVTLPVILGTYLIYKRIPWKVLLKYLGPFFLIMTSFIIFFLSLQFEKVSIQNYYDMGFEPNMVAIIRSFFKYVQMIVWPMNLSPYYDITNQIKIVNFHFVLSLLWLIFFIFFIVWSSYKKNPFAFFLFVFFVQLLPVLNILPHPIWIADRYLYFAAPFFYWPLAYLLIQLRDKHPNYFWVPFLSIISFLVVITIHQIPVWKNSEILWREVTKRYPNCLVANNNLAVTLVSKGEKAEALKYYDRLIKMKPSLDLQYDIVGLYIELNQFQKASQLLESLKPNSKDDYKFYMLLGNLDYTKGNFLSALVSYDKAINLDKDQSVLYSNKAKTFLAEGKSKEAKENYLKCLTVDPNNYSCQYSLGNLYAKVDGDFTNAMMYYKRALAIKPDHIQTLYDLGILSAKLNDKKSAVKYLHMVLKYMPNHEDSLKALKILEDKH